MRARLLGLTIFRAIATTLLLVALALRYGSEEPLKAPDAAEFASYAIIATVYFLTLATGLMLRWGVYMRLLAWAQIAFDLALASSVVLLSGGTRSPFSVLFLLAIVGASILLGKLGAKVTAVGSAAAYLLVVTVSSFGLRHSALGQLAMETSIQLTAQFLIAFLAGYLAEQLSRTGGRLSAREGELRRLTELQNHIVNAMPAGLLICTAHGRVTFINPAAREILGLEQAGGELVVNALLPGVVPLQWTQRAELIVPTPQGERTLALSFTPLGEAQEMSLVVFQDLTQVRNMQRELNRLDRLAELGRLTAQLAHEVRNPLASMRGAAQLLRDDTAGTPHENLTAMIVTEADRLSALLEGYLNLARLPSPHCTLTRVDAIAAQTVAMLRVDPASSGLVIHEALSPAQAFVDVDQLKQVLLNLLRNAIAAVRPNGSLGVRVHPEIDSAVLEVWDSAGSIAPENIDRLFEPHYSQHPNGTGLGLSTVKSIVHAHKGTIQVTSVPHTGTTFRIHFPLPQGVA